jgi:hypothetical protein
VPEEILKARLFKEIIKNNYDEKSIINNFFSFNGAAYLLFQLQGEYLFSRVGKKPGDEL